MRRRHSTASFRWRTTVRCGWTPSTYTARHLKTVFLNSPAPNCANNPEYRFCHCKHKESKIMYCIYTLTLASIKMFLRNRQALFFSLFMPLIILLIFGFMNFDRTPRVHLGLAVHNPGKAIDEFL